MHELCLFPLEPLSTPGCWVPGCMLEPPLQRHTTGTGAEGPAAHVRCEMIEGSCYRIGVLRKKVCIPQAHWESMPSLRVLQTNRATLGSERWVEGALSESSPRSPRTCSQQCGRLGKAWARDSSRKAHSDHLRRGNISFQIQGCQRPASQ